MRLLRLQPLDLPMISMTTGLQSGSVSYAQLKGTTKITISDDKYGDLINAKSDIEINPILGYAGVGYRF